MGDEELEEQPTLILQVTYPEEYPDVAPRLEIQSPHNSLKYPHLDVQEDRERLLDALQSTIDENMGMVMIFAVVDMLKEGAELLISERKAAIQALKEVEAVKAEEEENRKFHGTQVTRETFMAWRDQFKAEMKEIEERRKQEEREAEEKKKKGSSKEPKKLTGKQLWERGLAGKVDDDDLEGSLPNKLEKVELTA